ncbi:reverse transcriptase domain-containing protein [Tanacetum coccineum]
MERIPRSKSRSPSQSWVRTLPEVKVIEPVEPLEWKALENRLKPSSIEPPKLELKELPEHLEYAFLQENNQLPVVISSALSVVKKARLLEVLKNHKGAISWSIADIKGIKSSFCTHKILMEGEFKPSVQPQRRVNPNIKEVVPKKGGMTVVKNEKNKLIPQRTVTGWHVCIDYHKLNNTTQKDHFLFPFIDQMIKRLAGHEYYCFLDGFLGYFYIPIALEDQEKTMFTSPYGTFAYKRIPFGLCNAPATFQRCMKAIFHELIENIMEVFMDDFSVFGIVLGHKVSGSGIEVDKAKIEAISKLPYLMNVKAIQSFLGHASFYRRFIKVFSQVPRPMMQLLVKDTPFNFSEECAENLAADHLSRLENPNLGKLAKAEIRDLFPEERLMVVSDNDNEPWYADDANYLASRVLQF